MTAPIPIAQTNTSGATPPATGMGAASPIVLQDGTQLDPSVVKVMRAIRTVESNNNFDATGDLIDGKPASAGAFQWNNGKTPIAKGQLPTNFVNAAKQYGLDPTDFSPANQNKVAYAQISSYKKQGLSPVEIDALWNGAHKDDSGKYVHNNPARLTSFQNALQSEVGGQNTNTSAAPSAPVLSANQQADQDSKQKYGAAFGANTSGNQNPLVEGAKTLGNIIPSVFNFAKGALDLLNPVSTVKKIAAIGSNFGALAKESGGVGNAIGATAKALPGATYDALVPEAARDLIKGDTQGAQRAVTNDPVGTVLPLIFGAKGLAEGADAAASKAAMADYVKEPFTQKTIPEVSTKYGDMVDNTISKTGQVVTNPASYVFGKAGDALGTAAKYGASQLTGLDRSTLRTAAENPNVDFSKLNRTDLGQEIQSNLTKRVADLSDTGKEYGDIRKGVAPVKVDPDFIDNAIKKETGLDIDKKGNLKANTTSKIRDSGDVRALQKTYDFWKPTFKKGVMTAEEFLNFREDLAKAAKFEKDIGTRADVQTATGRIRANLNSTYRSQIPGLTELDARISPQIGDLKELRKGLVDKNGNLTDSGLTKIAKVSENRPALAAQLEKISPGILKKAKALQAAEDLRAASEKFKVGTYAKQAGQYGMIGGIATMNPVLIGGSIAEMILTNPENAVKMIQKYGQSKAVIDAAMEKLGNAKAKISPYIGKSLKAGAFSPRDRQLK